MTDLMEARAQSLIEAMKRTLPDGWEPASHEVQGRNIQLKVQSKSGAAVEYWFKSDALDNWLFPDDASALEKEGRAILEQIGREIRDNAATVIINAPAVRKLTGN